MRIVPTIVAISSSLAIGLTIGLSPAVADIPPHPDQIQFAPLAFEPPKAADYRHTLSSGVVVYMAPSHEFPLINLSLSFKGGSFLEPADKIGLASATGAMIRRGGTATVPPQELDEKFDFLAAQASASVGDVQSGASLNSLASNFDESFALFMDMVRNPGFDAQRLDIYKGEVIERLKQRNDDADPILAREWAAMMYGREHFEARQPTQASIQSITIDDLKAMHKRIFHPAPGQMWVAVAGDFEPQEMLSRLEKAFQGWEAGEKAAEPPAPEAKLAAGLYHVAKDIPQGKVMIGIRGIKRDDPDFFPLMIANNILGGGGFTSRITNRVRSDEGLAYHASSAMAPRVYYPGEIRATFASKNPTVALATKIIFEEIERIQSEAVTQEELDTAKKSFIETFPRTFESKPAMLGVFVSDEMTARAKDYWQTYRDKVKAVTAEDVQRVAKKYLTAANMAVLVVGDWETIAKGDERATMKEFFEGEATELPLRDPLTMEPIE